MAVEAPAWKAWMAPSFEALPKYSASSAVGSAAKPRLQTLAAKHLLQLDGKIMGEWWEAPLHHSDFWLVVSNIWIIFHFIYGIIFPIDELIFFNMAKTTNQIFDGHWSLW